MLQATSALVAKVESVLRHELFCDDRYCRKLLHSGRCSSCRSAFPAGSTSRRGACGVTEVTPTMIKAGLIAVGVGGVMALLGWRRVAVGSDRHQR